MGFFKRKKNPDCKKCGFFKTAISPYLIPVGDGGKGILIIGTQPNFDDDQYGKYGQSDEYSTMQSLLKTAGIDIEEDCYFMTTVSCYGDDELDKKHIDACRPNVYEFIKHNDIKLIIPMGKDAIASLYRERVDDINGSAQWRGKHIPDRKLNCWVCPIMDLDWYQNHSNDEQAELVWSEDLANAVEYVGKRLPKFPKTNVKLLLEYRELIQVLDKIIAIQPEHIAYDYEANTFRPYHPNSKLLTMSMYIAELDTAYAFPLYWRKHFTRMEMRVILVKLRRIMTAKHTKFIAHNLSMEDSWTSEILGFFVENWFWDTMIMQHLLDVTPKSKGLKLQAFLRFGVEGYDDYSKKYITATDDSDDADAVSFNKLEEANLIKVLEYNALDSFYTWCIYEEQVEEFDFEAEGNEQRKFISELYNDVAVALSRSTQLGFKVDLEYFEQQKEELLKQRAEIEAKIMMNSNIRAFKKHTGEEFKITSSDHLRILFYDIMGYKAKKKTKGGSDSADHEALTNLEDEVAQHILSIRKIDKIVGTYIGGYTRLSVNGFVHPDFLLHVARTGRSSNCAPNMQNVSKRDAVAKKIVRSGIIPPKGYHFGEVDYDTLEVKIFACYCKDPVLIKYLDDPHSDMHRDQAMKIFKLDDEWQITKTIRFEAKNGWVFALFYGSYWKSCARNIWEKIISQKDLILGRKKDKDGNFVGKEIHLRDHLRKKGIKTQEDFAAHLKRCEESLWNLFSVTREYQQNAFKSALEKGYVESYSGFRRGGYIERGQIINTPVQGQGCQCLLDSYRLLWKQSRREGWKTYFAGQIHDSMLPMFHPTEIVHVLNSIHKTMCIDMVEKNDWLIVPMGVEASIAQVNDPWYNLIDFKLKDGVWVSAKGEEPIEDVLKLPKQRTFV